MLIMTTTKEDLRKLLELLNSDQVGGIMGWQLLTTDVPGDDYSLHSVCGLLTSMIVYLGGLIDDVFNLEKEAAYLRDAHGECGEVHMGDQAIALVRDRKADLHKFRRSLFAERGVRHPSSGNLIQGFTWLDMTTNVPCEPHGDVQFHCVRSLLLALILESYDLLDHIDYVWHEITMLREVNNDPDYGFAGGLRPRSAKQRSVEHTWSMWFDYLPAYDADDSLDLALASQTVSKTLYGDM